MDQRPRRDPKPPARTKLSDGSPQQAPTLSLQALPTTSAKDSRTTEVHMIECWVFNGGKPVTASPSGSFTKDQISEWLKAPKPVTTHGFTPVAGLRLVCCEQIDSMKCPFDKATFEAIQDAVSLPKNNSYLHLPKSGACGKYLNPAGQPTFIYHRSNNNGTISAVLKYDPINVVTTGYILLGPRISLDNLSTKICQQFPEFTHPLLIPTILIETTATDLTRELYHINRLLTVSEDKTQSGDWVIQDALANSGGPTPASPVAAPKDEEDSWCENPTGSIQDESSYWVNVDKEMDACQDHYQLARILGWLSCRFAFMNAAVQCSISMVEFTLQELEFMKNYSKPSQRRQLKDFMNDTGLTLRIQMLESNLRHMAVFGAIEPRMHTQQTVLFNLINIGMAKDSKEVAEASKRDSSAMKIIAVLTTLFLPGTFIATFFAMPILNWSATSMRDVMTDHFWLYWAVAIPLTIVVMTIMGVYWLIQAREKRKAAENARKNADFTAV